MFPENWLVTRVVVAAPDEADIVRRAVDSVRSRLPAGWSVHVLGQQGNRSRRADALVKLSAPDGTAAVLVIESKGSVVTRDLPALLEQAKSYANQMSAPTVPVVVARYLGPSARAWLEERNASYLDATGNLLLTADRPALYLRDKGADRDPWRGPGRTPGSLKGPPAARVVRALVDFAPPVGVPELVRRSGASTGATYRVVDFLEQEMLIERDRRGPITDVRWRRLLERWSGDYQFQRDNVVGTYLQPRGIAGVRDGLAGVSGLRYAVTGSLAAERLAPYAPVRLAMIYVDEPEQLAARLGLRAVDGGANVLLATGDYDVVYDRLIEADGVRYAAPSQTAVDLLTSPGRSPAEGQALLDWMEAHEPEWRR